MSEKIKAVITGASGMVGEGVLHECLNHPEVESVLVVGRKPCGHTHPKLKELIHKDFYDLSAIENELIGYNACYFCLGASSVGMNETDYTKVTHTLTLNFANTLLKHNSNMTFCYVSGAGTDSTEKGRQMWARVKGKTENDIIKLGFKQAFAFRPGLMKPTPGLKNVLKAYNYLGWLYPFIRAVFPSAACLLSEVGQAMINVTLNGFGKNVLEVKDIVTASK